MCEFPRRSVGMFGWLTFMQVPLTVEFQYFFGGLHERMPTMMLWTV